LAAERRTATAFDDGQEHQLVAISRIRSRRSLRRIKLSRALLIERLRLEKAMSSICPRFLLFMCVSLTLCCMAIVGKLPNERKAVHGLLVSSLGLDALTDVTTLEGVREFMASFAEASSSFYPVNEEYVPDPERLKITTGMREYQDGRQLRHGSHTVLARCTLLGVPCHKRFTPSARSLHAAGRALSNG
jgi:hypothetical protein